MTEDAAALLEPPCLGTLVEEETTGAVPLVCLRPEDLAVWRDAQPLPVAAWVTTAGFRAGAGEICLLPGEGGALWGALVGLGETPDRWALAGLPATLPEGTYALADTPATKAPGFAEAAAVAWALGAYRFDRYRTRTPGDPPARLAWPTGVDRATVTRRVVAVTLTRDLVNTPAADMGPAELAQVARILADRHGGTVTEIVGDALLVETWPAVHAVGRASARAPRLLDLRWGDETHPRVTLVGKGVVFDTGGLDLKPAGNMQLMKKDMGGAAHALGLAHAIMAAALPVRLRVLIPAVENAVSGDSFRPLDVLTTRKGLTVEVGNTDAEGRLVLADALAEADAESPALLLDLATLTGAARVALGPDVPALFCRDDALAADLLAAGEIAEDPLWRLPLHAGYRSLLDSPVADLSSTGSSPHAGAITAALFLAEFVSPETPWAHVDLFAWAPKARPGRPEGGAAQGLDALFGVIARRFGGE